MPMLLRSVVPFELLTDIIRTPPRAATPEAFLPTSVPPPSRRAQVVPPLVVRRRPIRAPPALPKLLDRPIPATSVLPLASVGSNWSASRPMESEPRASLWAVQTGWAAVALAVRQTPPFTAPRKRMSGLVGCAARALTAPVTGLLGMPSSWPLWLGPGPSTSQGPAARRSGTAGTQA